MSEPKPIPEDEARAEKLLVENATHMGQWGGYMFKEKSSIKVKGILAEAFAQVRAERDQRIAELEKALQNTRENWGETSFRYSNCQADLARVTKERDEAQQMLQDSQEIFNRLSERAEQAEKALAEANAEAGRLRGKLRGRTECEETLGIELEHTAHLREELSQAKSAIREVLDWDRIAGPFHPSESTTRLRAIVKEE